VGLMLGVALLALVAAAVARQDLTPVETRSASWGLLLLSLGLLHLMLRRDALRAMLAFGALGLGVQVLDRSARAASLSAGPADNGVIVLVSALATAIVARLGTIRQQDAGSAWVSDAHDLHD